MPNTRSASSAQQHVSVIYGDGFHSFWLQRDATLAELAVHVGALAALHDGAPLTIDIAFQEQRRSPKRTTLPQQNTA